MEKRVFQAIGYRFGWGMPEPENHTQERFLDAIKSSLQAGLPSISYGIIGLPEPGLITGFDEGSEVLLGRYCRSGCMAQIRRSCDSPPDGADYLASAR